MTTFTAGIDGDYVIKVIPHSEYVSGTYSIRVSCIARLVLVRHFVSELFFSKESPQNI